MADMRAGEAERDSSMRDTPRLKQPRQHSMQEMPQAQPYPVAVASPASPRRLTSRALAAVFAAYFTSSLVINTLGVALPRIASELDGLHIYSWAISMPALASAFATLVFGKLSDMYGRRMILIASLSFLLLGAILSATSRTFEVLIAALSILGLGQGAIQPLCFSVLGDMFMPAERSKWAGLLNIPSGLTALIGPTLSGWFVDKASWRCVFWLVVPLVLLSGVVVLAGLPSLAQRAAHKIDVLGSVLLAVASSTLILAFSWAGTKYSWAAVPIIGLLGVSALSWSVFLWIESRAADAILDPRVLVNRTFITASVAALLSLFGLTAIMAYYPLFLQGVQNRSATLSGQVITPFSVLMAFMGVPAGLLLARTKRYKWMYVGGYGVLTAAMFGMAALTAETAVGWGFLLSSVAGIGLGAIPTINTLVVQCAVPRRLLGVATSGVFFFVMMGRAVSPAILGSAMNAAYTRSLEDTLPASVRQSLDVSSLASFGNPRVLLSASAMAELEAAFLRLGDQGSTLFDQTVQAIRDAMQSGLRVVFLIGAVTMLASFLLILSIPEIPWDVEVQERRVPVPRTT
jgi:MFS family permease